jgi:transcriptional repressor NrdR
MLLPLYDLRTDRAHRTTGGETGRHARITEPREVDGRPDQSCEKRPVSMERLDRAVEEILTDLHKDHLSEIPSASIGAKVMDKLHQIDPVAYVRYVSVYRQFENVNEFIAEIQSLSRRAARDTFQRRLFKE